MLLRALILVVTCNKTILDHCLVDLVLKFVQWLIIVLFFPATQEMMQIMQESEEVVLCLGSSTNIDNVSIFLQADCRYDYQNTNIIPDQKHFLSYFIQFSLHIGLSQK